MTTCFSRRRATSRRPLDPAGEVQTITLLTTQADRRRKLNQFICGPRVGKGKHGEVFLCQDEQTNGREVAVKAVKRSNPRNRIKLLRRNHGHASSNDGFPPLGSTEHSIRKEIAIMRHCRHGHQVRLLEVIDDPHQDKIYMAMEYLPGGQIRWANEEDQPCLTVDQTRRIIRDVIVGLEYLHYHGIIHRDIKPANLLWSEDRNTVKIVDFGISHFSPTEQQTPPYCGKKSQNPFTFLHDPILFPESDLLKRIGTPSFLAPEVVWFSEYSVEPSPAASCDTLTSSSNAMPAHSSTTVQVTSYPIPSQRPPITKSIDVWSLAITLYCLLFGHTPFNVPPSPNQNVHHQEFVLYNLICTQDWNVDETMGIDLIPTGGRHPKNPESEGFMIMHLLDQMLQKDPRNRITLCEVKRHPWFLRDIPDPDEWLHDTSPAIYYVPSTCRWIRRAGRRMSTVLHLRRHPATHS